MARKPETRKKAFTGIGTLGENSLHAALKAWYAQPGDQIEVKVDGYFIDVVRGEQLIEIQTRNFSALKTKLHRLVEHHPVRLVHPIAAEKWIVRLPAQGEAPLSRRRSPRRGRLEHLFLELVRIPQLIAHPNFTLEILLTREEEIRREDGKGSWRRKGASIEDRRLLEVLNSVTLQTPDDFRVFLPAGLPQPFTTRQLAAQLRLPLYLAGKMLYCLKQMEVVRPVGMQGRAILYAAGSPAYNPVAEN